MSKWSPARQNIPLWRGDDLPPAIFNVRSKDQAGTITPVDLTGYQAEINVEFDSGDVLISTTESGSPLSISIPPGETIPFRITWNYGSAFTELVPRGRGVDYKLWLINPSGERQTYLYGQILAGDN